MGQESVFRQIDLPHSLILRFKKVPTVVAILRTTRLSYLVSLSNYHRVCKGPVAGSLVYPQTILAFPFQGSG